MFRVVRLLDDRNERPLGSPAGLEQPVREVRPGAQLGNRQLEAAGTAVEEARAVAVTLAEPFGVRSCGPAPNRSVTSASMNSSIPRRSASRTTSGSLEPAACSRRVSSAIL
jgi:hypothetical protein